MGEWFYLQIIDIGWGSLSKIRSTPTQWLGRSLWLVLIYSLAVNATVSALI